MDTLAFDPATIAAAMNYLSVHGNGAAWQPSSEGQVALIEWYREHGEEADALKNLQFTASREVAELNRFLAEQGFNPSFHGFVTQTAVGVASVVNLLPRWAVGGQTSTIDYQDQTYRAFSLPNPVAKVFETEVSGTEGLVACLTTDDDLTLWLTTVPTSADAEPPKAYELIGLAAEVIASPLHETSYTGVTVPTVRFTTQGSVDWLIEMYAGQPEHFVVDQVFQAINVHLNEQGIASLPADPDSNPFVFDKPFIGWVTQPGVSLPICMFLADTSCWRPNDA